MRIAVLLLALGIGGCAHTHSSVNVGAGSSSGAHVSVGVHGNSHALAALVVAGMFIAGAAEYARDPYPPPRFSDFADWFRGAPPPPELDPGRRVNEQDCTRPIDDPAANLRCR
jgi:hypothetical protein